MVAYRERPRCRSAVLVCCKKWNCTLEELLAPELKWKIGDGMRTQARKMIQEKSVSVKPLKVAPKK
jgi:hypothetical protein